MDLHFEKKKLRISDEKAAEFASSVCGEIPIGIIQEMIQTGF